MWMVASIYCQQTNAAPSLLQSYYYLCVCLWVAINRDGG
jgi:hypothetical protein